MKFKFKTYQYQTEAVNAVVDCFLGQPKLAGLRYRVDMGETTGKQREIPAVSNDEVYGNAPLELSCDELLKNIQQVQSSSANRGLQQSTSLVRDENIKCKETNSLVSDENTNREVNIDVEMETGTGKTYCYIKTIYELNRHYGWNKFIIVVPSIAIREGVKKSLEMMGDYFVDEYGKKIRHFIYNSQSLHDISAYSTDRGINVMVINVQAFNSSGRDNRRIYETLDSFNSRRPISVIKANNPILILDEPQKMEGKKTLQSLKEFNALMMIRYSATHKSQYNKVYRLDAIDAYNQKLVKKISVRGISVRGQGGFSPYVYMSGFNIRPDRPPTVTMGFEQLRSGVIKRVFKKLKKGDNLYGLSKELEVYRDGYVITDIDAHLNRVVFENGLTLSAGEVVGDSQEMDMRRIQIRETIQAHFDKEERLFDKGIKCLSLFFIDEVGKYRLYDENNHPQNGDYAQIFEQEYSDLLKEVKSRVSPAYQAYLEGVGADASRVHHGYFSVDKKTHRMVDSEIQKSGETKGESKDVDAYSLILKNKERLLSFAEATRFIFSHSALSEGWDNPNVFTICTLKNTSSEIRRRQEIGRGLRLCVNQDGERQDHANTVHDINQLTVIPSESYEDFANHLQREIRESVSRPIKADEGYFIDQEIVGDDGATNVIDEAMARGIYRYLLKNDYIDDEGQITKAYHDAKKANTLADLPNKLQLYAKSIIQLIDRIHEASFGVRIDDDHKKNKSNPNQNLHKAEFLKLWNRINKRSAYMVDFKPCELVDKAVESVDDNLYVSLPEYRVRVAEQKGMMDYQDVTHGELFAEQSSRSEVKAVSPSHTTHYDLLEQISKKTALTRLTIAKILSKIEPKKFSLYKDNPEEFITSISCLINEQKATTIVEKITYNVLEEVFELEKIFTTQDIDMSQQLNESNELKPLKKHVYDYLRTDSQVERTFAEDLERAEEVVVYSKLPNGFFIPTPVGNYNPDWAIVFKEGNLKHVFFIAETKGSMGSMNLRPIEQSKIECAKKFFESINESINNEVHNEKHNANVRYHAVKDYDTLWTIVNS